MLNFELYNPTRLLFGQGQIEQLDQLIPQGQKILLVYGGGSIFKNGVYQQVSQALKNREWVEFAGVEPNPQYETLMKAVAVIRQENIQFILAVGGGSVIDGVKFISAAVHYKGDPIEIIQKKLLIKDGAMPFGTVLTLPATGSEMNSGAVVTIAATQEKLSFGGEALFPKFSICDPTVLASLPTRQIQNGIVDAFMHVMEQYLTFPQEAYLQDRIAEGILQTLIEIAPGIIADPKDYHAASNLMWCCTMALNGLLNKGVKTDWVTHAIGHELTALYGIDHARSLAIIAPNLYRVMLESKQDKLVQYGKRIWNITGGTDSEIALQAIVETERFFHSVGMQPKISDYTQDSQLAVSAIVDRFSARGWTLMGEKQNITLEKLQQIVQLSM